MAGARFDYWIGLRRVDRVVGNLFGLLALRRCQTLQVDIVIIVWGRLSFPVVSVEQKGEEIVFVVSVTNLWR